MISITDHISRFSLDPDLKSLNDKPEVAEKPKEESTKDDEKATGASSTSTADATSNDKPATEQSANTNTAATTTTTTTTEEDVKDEPAKEVVKPGSSFKYTPITFSKKPAATTTTSTSPKPLPKATAAAASKNEDIEKKIERAKRFNVPLDEKTKQQMRAERFGSGKKTTTTSSVRQCGSIAEEHGC